MPADCQPCANGEVADGPTATSLALTLFKSNESISMLDADETTNFELFRDCLSPIIVEKFAVEPRIAATKRKSGHGRKRSHAVKADVPARDENKDAVELAEELAEFVDVSTFN